MFRWLAKRVAAARIPASMAEIDRFTTSLRGMSGREIGMLLATATLLRVRLDQQGIVRARLWERDYELSDEDRLAKFAAPLALGRLIRDFQRADNNASAAAGMVWLFSLRAQLQPELRFSGQMLWQEMRRGLEFVEDSAFDLSHIDPRLTLQDAEMISREALFTPPMLDPETRD